MTGTWPEVLREGLKVPGLLVEVYGDLAKPGVQQVGKALETVLGLGNTILWPIAIANARTRMALDHNLEEYRRRLATVPEGDVVPLAPEVAVPILEKITYVSDVHLSQLYIALLAAASTRSAAELVHPSFVSVVNHLAPDEARLLESFGGPEFVIPTLSATWLCSTKSDSLHEAENSVLISPSLSRDLQFPHRLPAYVSNLAGLGLLYADPERRLSEPVNAYDELRKIWEPKLQANPHHSTRTLRFLEGNLASSQFGEQFFEACHAVPSSEA